MTTKSEPLLSLGFAAIDWIEHFLIHGPGDVQGQPIELDDEFAAFIVKAYRVDSAGKRFVRRAFLSRAKGRSKSGLAAMVACLEALGPCRFDHFAEAGEVSYWGYAYEEGEPVGVSLSYAEILCVATEEGQAGNTYDAILYMLKPETCSAELAEEFGKLDAGLSRINLPGGGFIEPVTSSDRSADGGKSTFIVADETHLWVLPRLKRLHGTMTRNLLKRKVASGWMLETSTMYGEGEQSVAEGTHAYADTIAKDVKRRRVLLFDHKQAAPQWDLDKRSDRIRALRESYGPAAAWMDIDALADSWDDPQVSEAEFRRFWLNQPVPTTLATPELPGWVQCVEDVEPPKSLAIGVAASVDQTFGSIAAAGTLADERTYVGAVDRREGTSWIATEAVRLQRETGCAVVIDKRGPASDLISEMEELGVQLTEVDTTHFVDACASFARAVGDKAIVHGATTELDAAVAGASKRRVGDRWAWGRRTSSADVSMLEAATLANWGVIANTAQPFNIW